MDSPQQALDALQREINLIVSLSHCRFETVHHVSNIPQLEQTGRLFAAANQSAPEAALARASRLKQQLPVSNCYWLWKHTTHDVVNLWFGQYV